MNTDLLESIIENLKLENTELTNKVNILYKLCKYFQSYIETHNLINQKVEFSNENGKQIKSLDEFDKIVYLKIPKAVYVVTVDKEDNK